MVSQMDKSADLFTLTKRSGGFSSHPFAIAGSPQPLQFPNKVAARSAPVRADRPACLLRAAVCVVFPLPPRFENAQVRPGASYGVPGEPCGSTNSNSQVLPIEQPSADPFGGEAA